MTPEADTPQVLKEYAQWHGIQPGWTLLTGEFDHVERLRFHLGNYDPDPVVDADKTQHAGLVIFGNDRTGRWAALPALMKAQDIVDTVLRITDPGLGAGGVQPGRMTLHAGAPATEISQAATD